MRRLLPPLIAAAWLWGTAAWLFPQGGFDALLRAPFTRELDGRFPEWSVAAWFSGLFGAMLLTDRLWCAYTRRRRGDPRKIHWSRLVNEEGDFICAHCLSPFLLPPDDFDEAKPVRCGDCGAAKATYGEMNPRLDPEGAVDRLRRMATGGLAGHGGAAR